MSFGVPGIASLTIAALVTLAAHARATTKQECIAASEKGQDLAAEHKPLGAREEFLICARDECPKAVRTDCTLQLAKAERSIATIVIVARRESGAPLTATHARIDD